MHTLTHSTRTHSLIRHANTHIHPQDRLMSISQPCCSTMYACKPLSRMREANHNLSKLLITVVNIPKSTKFNLNINNFNNFF